MSKPLDRALSFAASLGASKPIFLAPMAGACPPGLSAAVSNAGGMGACGAVLMQPDAILAWCDDFRRQSHGPFQVNLWIPDTPPVRDAAAEARQREFLSSWGPQVSAEAGDSVLPDFDAQCRALLEARPTAVSSIMGIFPPDFVAEMKRAGIQWFATATTVAEARAAASAGANAIIAQGMEAGGHRGSFRAADAGIEAVGLFALLPQICDTVPPPVIAAGGIADARSITAALMLGASAVHVGTGFLRCPEAGIASTWADRLAHTEAHDTRLTRAFSGRAGRAIRSAFVEAAAAPGAPPPAPYPVQRGLTRTMRDQATAQNDPDRMQMWAGQNARLAKAEPATALIESWWSGAQEYLR